MANRHRSGTTLIEVMIAIFVMAMVITPAIGVFIRVASNYRTQSEQDRAFMFARGLMAEILRAEFHDENATLRSFGIESDESSSTRADFDDVDDYDNFTESPLQFKDGQAIPDSEGYSRGVEIEYISPDQLSLNESGAPTKAKRIHVRVTSPNGMGAEVFAIRTIDSALDHMPFVEANETLGVSLRLQLGNQVESTSIEILNRYPH